MMPATKLTLPLLAGILALLLALECLLPWGASQGWQHPLPNASSQAALASDAEITQWANTILSRPLLSENRRPAPAAGATVDDTLPRLSAIIVIAGARRAIFASAGEKPQLVSEGGEIGMYRVKTVAPGSVALLGPDGLVTVQLQFSPAAASTAH